MLLEMLFSFLKAFCFVFLLGNLFSSLGSTVFDWYLSPTNQNESVDPSTVLRYVRYAIFLTILYVPTKQSAISN